MTPPEANGEAAPAPDPNRPATLEKSRLDWYFNEIFPIRNFHDYLSKFDVMSLREVCEEWRRTIDSLLETSNDIIEPNYNSYKSIIRSASPYTFHNRHDNRELFIEPTLNHSENVVTFLREVKLHPRNPFLCRQVYFHFIFDEDYFYWGNVWSILDHSGDELRSMKIFYRSDITSVEMLNIIKECVERTHLLTSLECNFVSVHKTGDGQAKYEVSEFPILPNLIRLGISFARWAIYHPFGIYFDQLVSLNVSKCEDFMDWWIPKVHSTFPRLQHFAVCISSGSELSKLHSLTGPLRELYIVGKLNNSCPSVYFHTGQTFKDTLAIFKIQQQYNCDSPIQTLEALGIPEPAQFELPYLRAVSLNITECGYGPVDSLLRLTRIPDFLEIIVFKAPPCTDRSHNENNREGREILQIYERLEDMYNSNVWELLPSLREIHVREGPVTDPIRPWGGNYTRDMYEFLRRGDNPRAMKRPRGRFD